LHRYQQRFCISLALSIHPSRHKDLQSLPIRTCTELATCESATGRLFQAHKGLWQTATHINSRHITQHMGTLDHIRRLRMDMILLEKHAATLLPSFDQQTCINTVAVRSKNPPTYTLASISDLCAESLYNILILNHEQGNKNLKNAALSLVCAYKVARAH
jgi:hypothetical protein